MSKLGIQAQYGLETLMNLLSMGGFDQMLGKQLMGKQFYIVNYALRATEWV